MPSASSIATTDGPRRRGRESPELLETLQSYALILTYLDRAAEAQALDARAAAIREGLDESGTP